MVDKQSGCDSIINVGTREGDMDYNDRQDAVAGGGGDYSKTCHKIVEPVDMDNSLEVNFSIAVLDELLTRIDGTRGIPGVIFLINDMIKELGQEV